jgi:hypothetical protein
MDATTVAVDLAKDMFEVALANRAGRIVDRKRLSAAQFGRFVDALPADTEVVMEACATRTTGGAAVRIGASSCSCCHPSTCARTSVGTRPIAPTLKPCSKPSCLHGHSALSGASSRRLRGGVFVGNL